jgi:hypothetical protein
MVGGQRGSRQGSLQNDRLGAGVNCVNGSSPDHCLCPVDALVAIVRERLENDGVAPNAKS